MLAECIIAEENIILCQIAEHGVRPMQHSGLNKQELLLPQAQSIPGLYLYKVPILMIMPLIDLAPFLVQYMGVSGISFISSGRAPL